MAPPDSPPLFNAIRPATNSSPSKLRAAKHVIADESDVTFYILHASGGRFVRVNQIHFDRRVAGAECRMLNGYDSRRRHAMIEGLRPGLPERRKIFGMAQINLSLQHQFQVASSGVQPGN